MSLTHELESVAVYCRVSSEEQREKETIKTQQDAVKAYLKAHPRYRVYEWYLDDGVTGTKALHDRRNGAALVAAAQARRFTKVLVTRPNRLGRKAVHILNAVELLESYGVEVIGVVDPMEDRFILGIKAVVAEEERRSLLENSAMGMARAAREGRFCGGIRPIGYRVEGKKQLARLVPNETDFWREWTEAGLVRQIYTWLLEGWSCYRIADHLNSLGVPTAYTRDDRLLRKGTRRQRTQNRWRPGRIRNMVVNPVYKGELSYGRRTKHARETIVAQVAGLVTPEVWAAAQRALTENRIITKCDRGVHLLRSLIRCGICELTYSWTVGRGVVWYRCNGQVTHRGKIEGRCPAKSIRGDLLEPLVWADVEGFLREPGTLLDELAAHQHDTGAAAAREAERLLIGRALAEIPRQRDRILEAFRRGHCTPNQLDAQMDAIGREEGAHRRRLDELAPVPAVNDEVVSDDLLRELRGRLDGGLDDEMRQQVLRLLVRSITVKTEIGEDGKKHARIVVAYNFPAVGHDSTGRGSWRPRA